MLLDDLEQLEAILAGVVDAGANEVDVDGPVKAFDPESITVGAAVIVVFALTEPKVAQQGG